MKKIPKHITILGLKVKVKLQDAVDINGVPVFGLYDADKREIILSKNQSKESLYRTYLHEFGHAVLDRIGLRVAIPGEIQEVICEGFANVIDENL